MKMIVDQRLELPIENQTNTLRKTEDRHCKRSDFVCIDLKLEAFFFRKKSSLFPLTPRRVLSIYFVVSFVYVLLKFQLI